MKAIAEAFRKKVSFTLICFMELSLAGIIYLS
jgi:hypothetical protein